MKLKTDPSYATIKYYYSDNTSSDTFVFKKGVNPIASSLITEDGRAYLSLSCFGKPIAAPESLQDDGIYPYNWANIKEIEWYLRYQPFDLEVWCNGTSMYSKEFWKITLRDLRDAKIKFINNDLKKDLRWIHAD
jgi:hypothetical protein